MTLISNFVGARQALLRDIKMAQSNGQSLPVEVSNSSVKVTGEITHIDNFGHSAVFQPGTILSGSEEKLIYKTESGATHILEGSSKTGLFHARDEVKDTYIDPRGHNLGTSSEFKSSLGLRPGSAFNEFLNEEWRISR